VIQNQLGEDDDHHDFCEFTGLNGSEGAKGKPASCTIDIDTEKQYGQQHGYGSQIDRPMEFQNKIIINKRDNNQRRQAGNQPDELLSGITVGSAFDNKKTKNCRNKYKEQKPPVVFF